MSDCMTFPDSVEDFMEQHKVVDTDCVYSSGIEFVPIFRMKQWFAAQPEIIRCSDCKHWKNEHLCESLSRYGSIETNADFYCGDAKRRTDER